MNNYTISKANVTHYNSIKELMLTALKEDQTGFSVSYEEYLYNSKEWWDRYINTYIYDLKDRMFIAIKDNVVIGMIGVLYEKRERKQHTASIVWFYVSRSYRGCGIGKELLTYCLNDIKSHNSIKKASLLVNQTQEKAVKLYEAFGFEKAGILKNDLYINGEFIDTLVMEKFF